MKSPITVDNAPNNTIISNEMITYAGIERIGLPPVTKGQSIDVNDVNANPPAAPRSPPVNAHTLTGL